MKKLLFLAIFLTSTSHIFSQTLDSLQGLWRFESIYHSEGELVDSTKDKMATKMFESLAFNFKEFDRITLSMFDKDEEGSYSFKPKKSRIIIYAENKKIVLNILEFRGERMAVEFSSMKFWLDLE